MNGLAGRIVIDRIDSHSLQITALLLQHLQLLILETFVDPEQFHGTAYRALSWTLVGSIKGYRRIRWGYSERTQSTKLIFTLALKVVGRALLQRSVPI